MEFFYSLDGRDGDALGEIAEPRRAGWNICHRIWQFAIPYFHLIDVKAADYRAAIATCAKGRWKGGRVHNAVHIRAAMQAKCDLIYTNDLAHFRSLAPEWGDRIQRPLAP